jgi:hypothetical protein
MLCHMASVRTDVSEELNASVIRVTRIGELGQAITSVYRLLVTADVPSSPILVTLMMEALSSSETSVLTKETWHNITEDAILHSHRCENLKSYISSVTFQMLNLFHTSVSLPPIISDADSKLCSSCCFLGPGCYCTIAYCCTHWTFSLNCHPVAGSFALMKAVCSTEAFVPPLNCTVSNQFWHL